MSKLNTKLCFLNISVTAKWQIVILAVEDKERVACFAYSVRWLERTRACSKSNMAAVSASQLLAPTRTFHTRITLACSENLS